MICFTLHIAGMKVVPASRLIDFSDISAWICFCHCAVYFVSIHCSVSNCIKIDIVCVCTDVFVVWDRMVLDCKLSP